MRGAVGVVVAAGEKGDAAGADESALEDRVVVVLDLGASRPFLQPRLGTLLLQRTTPEHRRRDAVEQRRLVKLDEGYASCQ